MKTRLLVLAVMSSVFSCAICSVGRSQHRADTNNPAAIAVRDIFRNKGINPKAFLTTEFTSKKVDPLLFQGQWNSVADDVRETLKKDLHLKYEPRLQLLIAKQKDKEDKYRVLLSVVGDREKDKIIVKTLSEIFDLEEKNFPTIRERINDRALTINVSPSNLKPAYVKGDKIDGCEIYKEAIRILQDRFRIPVNKKTILNKENCSFSITSIEREIPAGEKPSEYYKYYWRVSYYFDGVKQELDVRIDVGEVARANAKDPNKINWYRKNSTTDGDASLAAIQINSGTPGKEAQVMTPQEASTLGGLAWSIYEEAKKRLLEKEEKPVKDK